MKKTAAVIVILGLILAYFFLTKESVTVPDKPPVVNKPNVVSQAEPTAFDQEAWQAEWDRKNKIEMERIEQIWLAYLAGRKVAALDTEASYLEAYRDYKYYDHCVLPIGHIIYESDPVAAVMDVIPAAVNEAYMQLPEIQKDFIDQRIEKCVSLTHFNDEYMHPERVRNDLKKRMTAINPENAEEKELASVLAVIEQFELTFSSVERLKRGENIDQQLFFDLWQQKGQLEKQYPPRLSLFGGYADADMPLVNQLNEQIKSVEAKIEANKGYDQEALKIEQENLKNMLSQIEDRLFNTSSSDAYLAIDDLLNESRFESALTPIKKKLATDTQFNA
jgi:hypothetical protein